VDQRWIEEEQETETAYSSALDNWGYKRVSNFSFIVLALLYLPETRDLVAWDEDARPGIPILLHQDTFPGLSSKKNVLAHSPRQEWNAICSSTARLASVRTSVLADAQAD